MLPQLRFRCFPLLAIVVCCLIGCGDKTTDEESQPSTNEGGSEIEQALAQLPEADRTAAAAQRVCPVSDEPLGSMGTPPKVNLDGKEVFICCEGCEQELRKNPEKYLAKLQE